MVKKLLHTIGTSTTIAQYCNEFNCTQLNSTTTALNSRREFPYLNLFAVLVHSKRTFGKVNGGLYLHIWKLPLLRLAFFGHVSLLCQSYGAIHHMSEVWSYVDIRVSFYVLEIFLSKFYCDTFRLIGNTSSWTTYMRRLKILLPQGLDIFQFESKISLSHCLLCLLSFTNSFAAFALDVVSQVYVFV